MNQKALLPQEIVVWYILPSLRKAFANVFKEKGLPQKEIAKHLEITEAAVSQYLNKKRAEGISFGKEAQKAIRKSAVKILLNKSSQFIETQKLLSSSEVRRQICLIHHQQSSFPRECSICFS